MTYTIDTSHKSPNHSSRNGRAVSMIVLHATVGSGPSALAWLCNPQPDHPELRVSSHYLVYKTGYIYQPVSDDQAAWHAGKSAWHGLDSVAIEECSLGIEMENDNSGHDPYPPLQIASAHWLCQTKIAQYNIERADVVRHLDIATPPGRKTDPAGFPWPLFADSLYLDSPPTHDPHAGEMHYRVKKLVTAPVVIRSGPRRNAAVLGRLTAGDEWWGEEIPGDAVNLPGFGSGSTWIRSMDQRCVWAGLLEEVK